MLHCLTHIAVQFLRKCICWLILSDIPQERRQSLRHSFSIPAGIQKYLICLIAKCQLRHLPTTIFKSVYRQIHLGKQVLRADKDDIAFLQPIVGFSFPDQIQINHTLIISAASRNILLQTDLHLNIVDRVLVILQINIQPNPLCVLRLPQFLLAVHIGNVPYSLSEDDFEQFYTEFLIRSQNFTEKEIIRKGKFLILLRSMQSRSVPVFAAAIPPFTIGSLSFCSVHFHSSPPLELCFPQEKLWADCSI